MQFTATRWRELTTRPFDMAYGLSPASKVVLDWVSTQHALDLICDCNHLGVAPSAYYVGALHNAGYHAVKTGRIPKAKIEFAERVQNLYNDKP